MNDGTCLIAANAAGVRPSLVTAVYARLIAARQEADGHWETTDVRPPQSYSPFTATAVALRAIQLYGHPSQKADIEARAARARGWLLSHEPHATEERVYQLLGASWAAADQSSLRKMAAGLKATQQADGGWNSLDGRSSDAYSTGEALYALHEAGGVADHGPCLAARHRLSAAHPVRGRVLARGVAAASARAGEPALFRDRPSLRPRSVHLHDGREYGRDGAGHRAGTGEARHPGPERSGARRHRAMGGNPAVRQRRRCEETARRRVQSELRDQSGRGHRLDAGHAGRRRR